MGVKQIFSRLKEVLERHEKGLGVGFATGIVSTLGLSLLVPDTARKFVEEARGHIGKGQKHNLRDPQDRFFAEQLAEARKEQAPEQTAPQR
jgi:hypothetical protein